MALSPFPNSKKGERRAGKGCKDLTLRKNGAEAGNMMASLKATYFQRTNCQLQLIFVLDDVAPVITSAIKDVFQGRQRAVHWAHVMTNIDVKLFQFHNKEGTLLR